MISSRESSVRRSVSMLSALLAAVVVGSVAAAGSPDADFGLILVNRLVADNEADANASAPTDRVGLGDLEGDAILAGVDRLGRLGEDAAVTVLQGDVERGAIGRGRRLGQDHAALDRLAGLEQ